MAQFVVNALRQFRSQQPTQQSLYQQALRPSRALLVDGSLDFARLVHRTEGDFDAFLTDMGQSWFLRTAARTLNYGLGRVQVRCEQINHNEFKFAKILTDPTMRESHIHVRVGEIELHFTDDIGRLTATSRWESDEVLRFDATADATSLPLTLLMYLTSEGEFVEEMISGRGTSVKYIFAAQN